MDRCACVCVMADSDSTVADLVSRMLLKLENEEFERNIEFSSNMDFDPAYPQVLLLMVKWYWKTEHLGEHLKELYQSIVHLCKSEASPAVVKATTSRKWAIARALRFWMEHFPEDFKPSLELSQHFVSLKQLMRQSGDGAMADYMEVDTLSPDDGGSSKWFHQQSMSTPHHSSDMRRPSLGFDATTAEELAEIMAALDYKLFRRIPIKEFCVYAHAAKPTQDTPRIEECIQLFNGLTIWVVCSILKEHSAFRRADIVEKFIDTTKYLLHLHCYNTLLAVVGGLNHFSIRRLYQTWSKVDKSLKDDLTKRTLFFNSQMNYSTYRQSVSGLNGAFHIPVLGIVLKDLVAIDAQAKDYSSGTEQQLINMGKYRMLWNQLTVLRKTQMTSPAIQVDLDHMRILRAAIGNSGRTDDELEHLSMVIEPRQRDSASLNSSKTEEQVLPKFSEWAAGRQTSLDTNTLSKHVKQMVDAVFRAYDTDNSGSISMEEFESISSNFPFIECFSVLDQNDDGLISYDELLSYFLSANTSLRERFTHQFAEHTFLGNAVCEHCKGMMKGIVKQGVRCKDCGISCHKHCKDYVVVDCSKRKEKKSKKARATASAPHRSNTELYCDDDTSLKERLQRAEAARDALSAENAELLAKLAEANAKNHQLQSHIAMIRQHTIGFILEQMNTLNPSMDTQGTEV